MKLISPIQLFDISTITVEGLHRTALGLLSGTEIFVTRLSSQRGDRETVKLILTTIPPDLWPNLFRITCCLTDQAGAVSKTVSALKDHFNILILETLSTAGREEHELLAFVSKLSGRVKTENGIEKQLKKAIPDAVLKGCEVRQLHSLAEAYKSLDPSDTQTRTAATRIANGKLENAVEIEKLFPFGDDGFQRIPKRFISYSDTEEKEHSNQMTKKINYSRV